MKLFAFPAAPGMAFDGVDSNHLPKKDVENAMKIKLFGRV